MGVEERTYFARRSQKAATIATLIGGLAVTWALTKSCNNPEQYTDVRDAPAPAGVVEQQTMMPGEKYKPAVYVGPTIREYTGRAEEPAPPQRTGKNPWFYPRP
ncbi:hypothetical protein HZB90_04660 [archaeon]|nr:hypothetical protein [archaeon]